MVVLLCESDTILMNSQCVYSPRAGVGAMAEYVQDIEPVLLVLLHDILPIDLNRLILVANREQSAEPREDDSTDGNPTTAEGSRLVRVPIDELQTAKQTS